MMQKQPENMKKIVKYIVFAVMWLWSKIYTYIFSFWLKNKRDVLYTMWISSFLGDVGNNVRFSHPLYLEGKGQRNICIGNGTFIGHHTILGSWIKYGNDVFTPQIKIGNNCSIGDYNHITAIDKITLGDGVLTGRFVYIGDSAHGGLSLEEANIPPVKRKLLSKGEINIGQNVWIGDKVTILGGVTIGDNAIIGAGSVVNSNVPSNSMVAGVPAKLVKQV